MWKAIQAGDWQQVRAHMSESFVQIGPNARRDRDQTIQRLQQLQIDEAQLGEFETRPNGLDMVVTYVVTYHTRNPQPATETRRVLTVWQSAKRGWIEIAQSSVPINR